MRSISRLAVLLVSILSASAVVAADATDRPVYTNKARFRIPFGYDVQEMRSLGAREVRLYVSADQGARWIPAQAVSPASGRFEFEAPHDGEYWFGVRTLDQHNRLHPAEGNLEPGLKVVVDTAEPSLEIELQESSPGKVQLTWRANDLHLDESRLQLEYLQPGVSTWQRVGIKPSASGTTAWSIPGGGFVAVRGIVADLASNVTESRQRITITPTGRQSPQQAFPRYREPFAGGETTGGAPQAHGAQTRGFSVMPPPQFRRDGLPAIPASNREYTAEFGGQVGDGLDAADSGATTHPAPTAGRTRIINSTKFQVGYALEDIGPSGIASVELYVTEDGGRNWFHYGADPDHMSPFEISVPGDGMYGFTIRVRSGAGLSEPPPKSGEQPAVVVLVDETPPAVQLAPAEQGHGAAMNKVLIRWNVNDTQLAPKPIALAYAPHPDGPWEPITDWQPDTGQYVWTIGPGLPTRLYIRLTARDLAGNVTRAETAQPVVVDLSRPSARIVDVEMIGLPPR